MFTQVLVFITLSQYIVYCFIFMVVWSGSVFLFHTKSSTQPKSQRPEIEFNSLKSPTFKSPAVVPNLTPEVIEADFLTSNSAIEKGETLTPTISQNVTNEAFKTLLVNQIEPTVEQINNEFEIIADLDLKESDQWQLEGWEEEGRGNTFITDAFNDDENQDTLTAEMNHTALLEELLTTHELVCEMQKDLGCDYMTALSKLPESAQAIYDLVGFQPERSDN